MKNSVQMGFNKTGLALALVQRQKLFDGKDDLFKDFAQAEEDPNPEVTYEEIRKQYIAESGSIGTVPPPATVTGVAVTGYEKLTAGNPEVLMDKLGERLAFERTGARLYEALITKCETQLPQEELGFLREIYNDEVEHFQLVHDAIRELGADTTAVTPCANVAGVMASGIVQIINDPRTSITQSVNAILVVELADNEGWDLLIQLAQEAGLTEIATRFRTAKEHEDRHVSEVRNWLKQLVQANDVTALH